ncbi:MAG: hypothetical protein Q8P23_02470 [bacterium]|nr:hypothetical protein [bacterium]
MPHETFTSTATAEAPADSPEVEASRLGFAERMRNAVAREMKLTFTLPKPGEGLFQDLGFKTLAAANIAIMNLWFRGAEYTQSASDTDSLPFVSDKEFMTEVLPTSVTALGVAAIFLANRNRRA